MPQDRKHNLTRTRTGLETGTTERTPLVIFIEYLRMHKLLTKLAFRDGATAVLPVLSRHIARQRSYAGKQAGIFIPTLEQCPVFIGAIEIEF